jgi:hypothetical protein
MFFEASSRELLTEIEVRLGEESRRFALTDEISWENTDDSGGRNGRVAKQLAADATQETSQK